MHCYNQHQALTGCPTTIHNAVGMLQLLPAVQHVHSIVDHRQHGHTMHQCKTINTPRSHLVRLQEPGRVLLCHVVQELLAQQDVPSTRPRPPTNKQLDTDAPPSISSTQSTRPAGIDLLS